MKRYNFTINELLTVIAIIAILAGILIPVLMYSRRRARQTDCMNNQGQVAKLLISSMDKNNSKLKSGTSGNAIWTTQLYEKKMLPSLEVARCPEFSYDSNDISDADARKEALGVVAATSGEFDFKSNKLLRIGNVSVGRSNMLIGGCAGSGDKANAVLDLSSSGQLLAIHGGAVNVFFLDGTVQSIEFDEFADDKFCYPLKDNSGAGKVDGNTLAEK